MVPYHRLPLFAYDMKSIQTNQAVVRALAQLQHVSWGKTIITWFFESREEQRNLNDNLNGNDLYRGQGRSLVLSEILDEIKQAPDAVTKMGE